MAQYKVVGQTTDSEGNTFDVLEAQYAPTRKGVTYQTWFVCPICGRTYSEDRGVVIRGQRYCTVRSCSQDARS